MTWGEFKAAVEAQGVKDEALVYFIDVMGRDYPGGITVEVDDREPHEVSIQ